MKILVTGSAGYIGSLIVNRLTANKDIEKITGIDLLPPPERIIKNDKISWIQTDLARDGWQKEVLGLGSVDVVVHSAFKIRSPLGRVKQIQENNLAASGNVFRFCFENKIPKLIYLSSVAAYGARPENIGRLLKEESPLKENENPYGFQKCLVESRLKQLMNEGRVETQIYVLRLNSVTGPLGQSLKEKFGLITFLRKLLPFVIKTTPYWARQFVHEKDVEEIIYKLSVEPFIENAELEVFNVAPKTFLTAEDIGRVLNKKTLKIPKWLVRPLFAAAWYLSLGLVPTRPESSNGLIYPINVDGGKIERIGFKYHYTAADALLGKK